MSIFDQITEECQYPKSDNFHFYVTSQLWVQVSLRKCQYPKSDNFHFYGTLSKPA